MESLATSGTNTQKCLDLKTSSLNRGLIDNSGVVSLNEEH
jgi:hypothetical protein